MDQRGNEVHTSTTEASAGSREGVVRWVLIIGLLLIVIAFAVIVMTGMLSQDDGPDSQYNVSREMAEQEDMSAERDGEPIPPAFGEDPGTATEQRSNSAPDSAPAPTASATPGDAPAGDPTNTAQ